MSQSSAHYVKSIRKLLTPEEEKKLFEDWRAADAAGERSKANRLLTKITLSFTPLVKKLVNRMSGYRLPEEELISEAMLALTCAAYNFDPDRGFKFATFAQSYIKGMLFVYIKKNYFMTNVCANKHIKKLFFSIRRAIVEELRKTQTPTLTEESIKILSKGFDIPEDDIVMFSMMFSNPYESLNETVGRTDSQDQERQDWLADERDTQEEIVIRARNNEFHQKLFQNAMKKLTERERIIYEAQNLRDREDQDTLVILGDQFGLSKERIRQLRNRAEEKIKRDITNQLIQHNLTPADIL